ncbi:MAG: carbon-nitrogen hydrolase family protein [Gammaproteobacteria bacterium]|jgi:predicted amidohydrolase|nr:carbon-nitrogen hydrolase family protein [Gammaproteobacteria bacterium]MBQ0775298.1 carbon-nitrogen hydrolase family protein [Gammaproteobacteria bacterium]
MLSVAAVQMTSTVDFNANLREAERLMHAAKQGGAELILLPENFASYGGDYRQLAEQQGLALQAWLQHWAKTLEITLIGGTIPLAQRADGTLVNRGRVRSACLMYSSGGVLLGRYDKLHLFDVSVDDAQGRYCESDSFEPGDRLLVRAAGPVKVGLAVCYDLRFALLAGALAQAGANLLVYPSAFTEVTGAAHWHLLLRARAVETGCYVLAANQCGQHTAKRQSYGHSILIDPWGSIVAELNAAPGVLVAEIDLNHQKNIRNKLPLHQHQRLTVELPNDIRFDE